MRLCGPAPDWREVHVWFVELALDPASAETCSGILSADERERASRFRFERTESAFTLSRGILRALLGRYLAIEPDRVRFAYEARGKPRLAFPESSLQFNLAHSGEFAAYAFASGCAVGVDIEKVRTVPEQESIVRRFFAHEECEEWLDLEAAQRDGAFYLCWTRKEAYIKALGGGLSIPLDSFRVSLRPGAPASPIHATGDPAAASGWSLYSLSPADGYIASLAVPEGKRRVRIVPRMTAAEVLESVNGALPFPPASKEFAEPSDGPSA
jgi:4'-phosphopantetheinyl transferase